MSEFINNQSIRQEKLKKLIRSLHDGKPLEQAKQEFKEEFGSITTAEITAMEQGLIKEGMAVSEIQRLCDVHAAVFEGSIADIHAPKDEVDDIPGHPVHVFLEENERLEKLLKEEIEPYLNQSGKTAILMLRVGFDRLKEIDKHYARKEYLFFPHLERKGITAPPKVMWGVDDEIRADIKSVIASLSAVAIDEAATFALIRTTLTKIRDMISKENNILIPLLKENLNLFNWISVELATPDTGWFLEKPKVKWEEKGSSIEKPKKKKEIVSKTDDEIRFDAGSLSAEQINAMLNALPFDMTFVDHEGYVRYFTQGKERIFARPATIIGRHVSMCHPPASVHVVEGIIESFRSGRKDHEDFWIRMKDMFVYIRYYAVRNARGEYLGTLEITQNIKPITELQGEKRLVDK
ncbi:MAG: DUF438 domain-containing protein [Bacilli bacterium]|jgi:hypothetical protein|nr:DUF438 domain-containing protein [Bacilli bacterium]